ncbi:hypothetical protein CMO83_04745 [Candidatus Woesearchaeota archaeon]|jgi:hypothetical protein|nr:hypothetical protein [Candidatus Woesearchaeota archaeon]MDP6648225.1 hypothetical protein [Candidatus Woesearchaeota archaeon]|tara:strand:- start:20683 stop:21105 length:423 start_codon:yes stop_codon:yes gene_type:complete
MAVKLDVGELLFGHKLKPRFIDFLIGEVTPTVQEARETLDAITHQEVRTVLTILRGQMERGVSQAKYDLFGKTELNFYLISEDEPNQLRRALLFSGYSYRSGIYQNLLKLVQAAYPDYELKTDNLIGQINFTNTARRPQA